AAPPPGATAAAGYGAYGRPAPPPPNGLPGYKGTPPPPPVPGQQDKPPKNNITSKIKETLKDPKALIEENANKFLSSSTAKKILGDRF
ncbi:unnamed protein product, partial [Agarophyton chilense]